MSTSPEYYYLDGQKLTAVDNNNDGTKTPIIAPANITTKFREAFETYDPSNPSSPWIETRPDGDLTFVDGNTAGASYLVVSKSPWTQGTETRIESRSTFSMPVEMSFGAHMSQRTVGQEFSIEIIDNGTPLPEQADLAIASISQATTVLTVNTVLPHGLTIGRCVGVRGVSNPAANYPQLVVATIPTPTQFTCTVATGTITAVNNSGFVYIRQRLGLANNGVSEIFENATATNANLYIRSESGDALPSGTIAGSQATTVGTTASVQLVTAAYSYAFAPTTEFRINIQADRTQWYDSAVDAVAQTTSRLLRTQICPDPSVPYKFRIRATNNKSLSVPVAQIVSAVKTGTTTATITCDREHGLTTSDVVVVYGINNQGAAAFPNLATATAVASIVSPTAFTIVIGTASTVTSYGGYVARINGGNLISVLGGLSVVAQSAVLSTLADGTRQLVVTGSGNWAGVVIGDLVELIGVRNVVDGATLNVDGPWKVANFATTALTLVLPFNGQRTLPADFGSTNCGGGVIRRTDLRMSFVRIFDYERERVEALARPSGDSSAAFPVAVQNSPAVTVSSGTITTVTTVTGVTTVSAVTSANLGIPGVIADVASAALTTTTTTAAFTPTFGTSYEVNIPVTAVTGTTPTLDVTIEESDDSGTNWYTVYSFPRITATGIYRSPKLSLTGNRVRYVQTVGGGTPSFTRAINRLQASDSTSYLRQLIDRSVSLTTLNSSTPNLNVQNCVSAQLVVNVGAITTTAPQLQLQGSDDNGASWYSIGSPLTAVASSTVQLTVVNLQSQLIRALVSTAGVGVTPGYVLVKGF